MPSLLHCVVVFLEEGNWMNLEQVWHNSKLIIRLENYTW